MPAGYRGMGDMGKQKYIPLVTLKVPRYYVLW